MSERKDELVEKILDEVKKEKACRKSPEAQPNCGGKTPMERRWNIDDKDKPAQA